MDRTFYFRLFFITSAGLLLLSPDFLFAQNRDYLRDIVKESLKVDFFSETPELKSTLPDRSDSLFYDRFDMADSIVFSVNRTFTDSALFSYRDLVLRYRARILFPDLDELNLLERPALAVSPWLTTPYTNQLSADLSSTETDGEVFAHVFLVPLLSVGLINFNGMFDYLIRTGVIPYDDPVIPRKSRKEKNLREIVRDIYHIDDPY